jgi:hypothetical protein
MLLVQVVLLWRKMQKYVFQGDDLAAIFEVGSGRNLVEM